MFMVLHVDGRAPSDVEFADLIRQMALFDRIEGAGDELRELVALRCPDLLSKLQPSCPSLRHLPNPKAARDEHLSILDDAIQQNSQ